MTPAPRRLVAGVFAKTNQRQTDSSVIARWWVTGGLCVLMRDNQPSVSNALWLEVA